MSEYLDIVDEKGCPTGQKEKREVIHSKGLWHRTSHVWILRHGTHGTEVLLQKRSSCKDSHPGCYDISSAGHIPCGQDYMDSALRELEEELGILASAAELRYLGQRTIIADSIFHGIPFHDRQISRVYCLWRDVNPSQLTLQESEVASVCWMPLAECKNRVSAEDPAFPNCIYLQELDMLPLL